MTSECKLCPYPIVACVHVDGRGIAFVAITNTGCPVKPFLAAISPWWEEGDMQARVQIFATQEEAEAFMHNPPPFERD